MPRIPRLQSQVDVSRGGAYSANGVAPMGNAEPGLMQQMGRNIERLGAAVDSHEDRYNQAAALQAINLNAAADEQDLDGPEGYTSKLGQDAARGRESILEKLQANRKAQEDRLENPNQREAFRRYADHRALQTTSRVNAHHGQQVQVFEQSQLATAVDQQVGEFGTAIGGAKGGTVAGDADAAVNIAMARAGQLADAKGWRDGPLRDELLRKTRSALHTAAVGELIRTQQPEKARAYLAGVPKTDLDVATADRLQDLVKRGNLAEQSLNLATNLAAGNRPLLEQKADLDAMRTKGLAAEVYDATWGRLRSLDAEVQQQRAIASNDVLQQATAWGLGNPKQPFAAMPPALQQAIARTGNVDRVSQFLEEGRWRTTPAGLDAYLKVTDQELRGTSQAALVDRYRDHLDNGKLEKLVERWRGLQDGKKDGAAKFERDLVLGVYARRMAILPKDGSKPSPQQTAAYEEFELRVDNAVRASTGGKGASPADYEKTLQAMEADKFKIGGALWGFTEKTVAGSTAAELNAGHTTTSSGRDVSNASISDAERAQILAAITTDNEEIQALNAKLPLEQRHQLKPTTLAQIAEEWDQQQIEQRAARSIEHERRRQQLLEAAQPGPRPGDQFLPPALQPGKKFTPPPVRPPR